MPAASSVSSAPKRRPHHLLFASMSFLKSVLAFEWPKRLLFLRAILVVTGGFLVHISLGTLYTYGNIAPYIVSYIRNQSHPENLRQETTTWIYACMLMGQGSAMFVGGWMVKRIGPRWTSLIGGWIMSLGVGLSYFTIKISFWTLFLTYGLMFGVGTGIAYIGPLTAAMNWMPKWKGFANGIVVAGFGLGALIFNSVQTTFVNPHNLGTVRSGNGEDYFTDPELLDRVPVLFVVLGVTYAVMQLVGSLLLTDPPDDYNTSKEDSDECSERESLIKSEQYHEVDDSSYKTGPPLKEVNGSINAKPVSKISVLDSYYPNPQLNTLVDNQESCEEADKEKMKLHQDKEPAMERLAHLEETDQDKTEHLPDEEVNVGMLERKASVDGSMSSSVTAWSKKNVVASLKPLQVLKKPNFYLLWYMFLANGLSTTFIATLYKFFGQTFIKDGDHFLASVGSVAAIFNCSGRIFWGLIADKISYKFALVVVSGVMTIFTLTLFASSEGGTGGKTVYFIWICIIFFCVGGNFSLFPTAIGRAFGLQYVSINYGLLFTSQIAAGSIGAMLSDVLKTRIGYDGLLFLVSGFTFSSFILAIFYKPKRYISLQPK